MALSCTSTTIKEKCGITVSSYDSEISNLIAAMLPVIEHSIRPEHVADLTNTGLQATLNLAAAELIAGEFFSQLSRKPGHMDTITIGGVTLKPFATSNLADPSGLKEQGLYRLRLYLKVDPTVSSTAGILSVAGKRSEEEK